MTRSFTTVSTALLAAALAVAAGLLIPTLGGRGALVLVAALAILPIVIRIATTDLALGLALFMAAQPLEHFEHETPAGTLSPGVLLLGILLVVSAPEFGRRVKSSSLLAFACLLGGLWLVSVSVMRLGYLTPYEASRHAVTSASFLAVAVVAASVPPTTRTLRVVGLGAGVGLLTFAVAGLLVSQGILPEPEREFNTARSLLGIESPFTRSYGLDVSIDSIALLAALPLAYLSVHAVWRLRIRDLLPLGLLVAAILLIFQARGMLAQAALALVAAVGLRYRRLALVAAPLMVLLIAQLAISLYEVDRTSSSLRIETSRLVVVEAITSPQAFISGRDEREIYLEGARNLRLQYAVSGQDTIHNLFLSNLYGGGWLGLLSVGWLWVVIVAVAAIGYRQTPGDTDRSVLLVASILVLLTLSIEPVASNTSGAWLVAGVILAWLAAKPSGKERI